MRRDKTVFKKRYEFREGLIRVVEPACWAGLPAAPWPPPPTTRLPSPVVSATSLDRESTTSGLTSPLVLAAASRRIPRLVRVETVAGVGSSIAPPGLRRRVDRGSAPVARESVVRALAASRGRASSS